MSQFFALGKQNAIISFGLKCHTQMLTDSLQLPHNWGENNKR